MDNFIQKPIDDYSDAKIKLKNYVNSIETADIALIQRKRTEFINGLYNLEEDYMEKYEEVVDTLDSYGYLKLLRMIKNDHITLQDSVAQAKNKLSDTTSPDI